MSRATEFCLLSLVWSLYGLCKCSDHKRKRRQQGDAAPA